VKTDCLDCPLRRNSAFLAFTEVELAFMRRFKAGELTVTPHTTVLLQGAASPQLFTALSGWGVRYKLLPDGGRQVINFVMPGDLIGLQAGLLGEMQHSVDAVTDMTLCVFARADLWSLFKSCPERAYDLTWLAAREEHFLGDMLATIGRRAAVVDLGVPVLGALRFGGYLAWLFWLFAHIYFLIGFRNRLLVLVEWAWAYWTFERNARVVAEPPAAQSEADRCTPR